MTVVVACRFLKTVAVIADCRVSYGDDAVVDDNLQKIYQFDDRMVLGFAGPIKGANQVIESVRAYLETRSKYRAASNLVNDIERRIRHEYRQIKQSEDRKGLSFMLATVEPRREARSKWRSTEGKEIAKPKWFPYVPEFRVLALKPSQSTPDELVKEEKGKCIALGIQERDRRAIQDTMERLYDFVFKQPMLQAIAVVDALMLILMERQVRTVGGLFQCAVLGADGIQWLSYSLPSNLANVALDIVDGRYVQRDNRTGREVPLKRIWEWWQEWQNTCSPGSSGIFEDPGLRKAAEYSRNANDDRRRWL